MEYAWLTLPLVFVGLALMFHGFSLVNVTHHHHHYGKKEDAE